MSNYHSKSKELKRMVSKDAQRRVFKGANVTRNTLLELLQSAPRTGEMGVVVPGTSQPYRMSAPGQPPAVATSRHLRSWRVMPHFKAGVASAALGSELEYSRRLELGFHGTDSKGRTFSQAARPSLVPAAQMSRREVEGIMRAEMEFNAA